MREGKGLEGAGLEWVMVEGEGRGGRVREVGGRKEKGVGRVGGREVGRGFKVGNEGAMEGKGKGGGMEGGIVHPCMGYLALPTEGGGREREG